MAQGDPEEDPADQQNYGEKDASHPCEVTDGRGQSPGGVQLIESPGMMLPDPT